MGKPTGFLEYKRETARVLPPKVRIANFNEFRTPLRKEKQKTQGARCMACGVPFCHFLTDAYSSLYTFFFILSPAIFS